MECVVEFGLRGGPHTEAVVMATIADAEHLAAALVAVFENGYECPGTIASDWRITKGVARLSWQSPTHFVGVSRLDGVPRGPLSAQLWSTHSKHSRRLLERTVVAHWYGGTNPYDSEK